MPLSKKHKCLFIHIPKTGGSSIEAALGIFRDWNIEDREYLFGLIQSNELTKLNFLSNFLQHLTIKQCQAISPTCKDYFSFSFVRNPWDKMVSIYSNLDNNLVQVAAKKGIHLKNLSFDEFIIQTGYINHIHLEHQYKFITNSKEEIKVDFLGKFESLESDFHKLCSLLNINLELPCKNKSNHDSYRNYYNRTTKAIIAKRYHKDIQLFGYRF